MPTGSESSKRSKKSKRSKRYVLAGILAVLGISVPTLSFAAYRAQGWSWYNSAPVDYSDEDAPSKEVIVTQQTNNVPMSYSQQLADFQAYHKEVYDKALITQNVDDVAYAAQLNQWVMEQSKGYGRALKEALLKYPDLSHELKFPTAQVARQVAYQEEKKERACCIKAKTDTLPGLTFKLWRLSSKSCGI